VVGSYETIRCYIQEAHSPYIMDLSASNEGGGAPIPFEYIVALVLKGNRKNKDTILENEWLNIGSVTKGNCFF
jgi:hypothetical protein